jgi:hypothetical protein
MLRHPPLHAYSFSPCQCYELLYGKLYDANAELTEPEPKPPKIPYPYRVDVFLANLQDRADIGFHGQSMKILLSSGEKTNFQI